MSRDACALCGQDLLPVRMGLVEWREPVGAERFSVVPRCVDRVLCRRRVESELREPWPLADTERAA